MISFFNKIGIRETDSEEEVLQKNFMVYLGGAMSMGGLVWGTICLTLGLYLQCLIPYGYAVLTACNFYLFHHGKNFRVARFFQVFISLLLPFAFQFVMGGFMASGGVMLWAIISLIAALTFTSFRSTLYWWLVYVALTILMGIYDGHAVQAFTASPGLSRLFFVINISIISSIVFGLSYYFVSSNRQASERIAAARKQAEAASRVKSEFLANMSHEIRTPLNGIIGFSELMMKTRMNETQQQYMNMVSESGNLLLDIINDILDFSKIEAGKLELVVEKSSLPDLCGQVADMIRYQAHKKGLELLLNIPPGLPRYIWADEIRLRQILMNLLSNAVKFTETGEIELKIEALENSSENLTAFRFSVRDTGIGVDPQNQEKIFRAFSQEDGSTTKRFGGTGLGLTISNKLLALMGSKLQLISQPGHGSTFYFDITLHTANGVPVNYEGLEHLQRALVVDDNTNNRHILRDMLKLVHIDCEEAADGATAINKIKAGQQYDVLIMDYHMPGLDGLETVAQIRELLKNAAEPPVVLLYSSSDDADISAACRTLQIQQRLVKPAKMNQLFGALSRLSDVAVLPAKPAAANGSGAATVANRPVKVLVAEDNSINMLLAKTFIKKILPAAIIYETVNGAEAVSSFKEVQPDIVFMDIQMPGMNGYDATAAIREAENGHRTPIIALTAGTVKGEREKCLDAGMDDYMTKPFVRAELEKVLQQWVVR